MQEYCRKYGPDTFVEANDEIKNYSERRMRAMISALPDGTYEAGDVLDDAGTTLDPVRVQCRLTIDGDTITTDFGGCDPQVQGPINATYGVTASSVHRAVPVSTRHAVQPWRLPPIKSWPLGSVVNPYRPRGSEQTWSSSRIMDVLLACFAQAVPTG